MTQRRFASVLPYMPRLLWLCAISAILIIILTWLHLPAALLIGAMIGAIIMALHNNPVSINRHIYTLSQAIIGAMMGTMISTDILVEIMQEWQIFFVGVFSTLVISVLLGCFLAARHILPGTTAIWGSLPGASSTMIYMADIYGDDARLVAVMQYLRVVLIAFVASYITWMSGLDTIGNRDTQAGFDFYVWLLPHDWLGFGGTIGIILVSLFLMRLLRMPSGMVLFPLILTAVCQNLGLFDIVLPPALLALAFMLVGWHVGGRFNRAIVLYALKALPILFTSTIVLIFLCSLIAAGISWWAGYDLLTSFLATCPGGADTVSIIAAGSPVNMAFVISYQTLRYTITMLCGPFIARFTASYFKRRDTT